MTLKLLALACVIAIVKPSLTNSNAADDGACTVIQQTCNGFEQRQGRMPGPDVPVAVGPPGKSGPVGRPGPPGQIGPSGLRGDKGEPAENVEESEQFLAMKQKLLDMEIKLNSSYDEMQEMKLKGVRMIWHDSETEIKATNCPGGGGICYRRNIVYSATDAEIRALIDSSAACRQYVKFRCYSIGTLPQWVDRHGRTRTNFGSRTDGKCACGEAGTCDNGRSDCTCMSNDGVWRQDEGYFTVKDDLPVKALLFGDLNSAHEEIYHTLGKLECMGWA